MRQSPGSARRGTVSQPSHSARQASTAGRIKHTSRWGISWGANQDVKTTKRTATARGHSNLKRGRQGHRHTKTIAGCIRIRLSWLEVSAIDRVLEERGEGHQVNPVTRLIKCPMNTTLGERGGRDTHKSVNWQNYRHEYLRNVAQEKYETPTWAPTATAKWQRLTRSSVRRYKWSHR